MDSSSKYRGWTPILIEVAEKVRSNVCRILKKRSLYQASFLKLLLDSKAQESVVNTLECSGISVRLISARVGSDMEFSHSTTLKLIVAYGVGLLEDIVGLFD